jgi:hypothetical protein
MINDNIDVHNGIANGTTAEFVKAYLKRCKTCSNSNVWLLGILCHGWRSRSAEFEWQDYDRFKGTCDPTQGVQSFQWLRRARKSACRLQWTLPISHSWKLCPTGHKLQGKSVNELVGCGMVQGEELGVRCSSRVRTLAGLFLEKPIPSDI